ncbi:hypothetical protein SLEP1_g6832 [Rubroshorea leprosula]|uniref:Uncharacterized protein n=1 Tax=Rubroshorea leprosula TaxID=152421 RepID=A0AAV5I6B3_9ROSI|nr:hypothetical protein SLEP1_g6832 [Rubroshorea leprosula]
MAVASKRAEARDWSAGSVQQQGALRGAGSGSSKLGV